MGADRTNFRVAHGGERLWEEWGRSGAELASILPEIRSLPGFVEPEPIQDPDASRFRMFDAYAQFTRRLGEQAPLVVVLEDVHWADRPTLQLLQHLARELVSSRVLVIATSRDTDITRASPLTESLAELNRGAGFQRIVLRGLDEDEVHAFIAATTGRAPATGLAARVFEETEGNPFFLSQIVSLLTEEGRLDDSVSDIPLPDGVREALGRRLDRLSEEANALLTTAAVVGREFEYETLTLLTDGGDEALLGLIEEGLDVRVIEELDRPGRFRFTHALTQETLLEELSTTRRVRLHSNVAEGQRQISGRTPRSEVGAPVVTGGPHAAAISESSERQRAAKSRRCSARGIESPRPRRQRKYCRNSSNAEQKRAADAKLPKPRIG